jgi:hypothetical protein
MGAALLNAFPETDADFSKKLSYKRMWDRNARAIFWRLSKGAREEIWGFLISDFRFLIC